MEKVFDDVEQERILDPYLIRALRFYLIKVMRIFLNQPHIVSFIKDQPKNEIARKVIERIAWYDR